ncbi:MAG TPA: plastocyanin/azurin family copper-binding protein [Actinomycetota bacterium]
MGRRALAIVVFLLIALSFGAPAALAGGGGCHGGEFTDSRGVKVDVTTSACFTPTVIRIQPGQAVTWTNRDGTEHTVTGAGARWGTYDSLLAGKSVTYRFRDSGVYPYFCAFHPGMVGAVVVGDGTSGATTTQDIVPVLSTPQPATPAPQPASAAVASHGVSGIWRAAAIAGFALFLAAAGLLAAQFFAMSRNKRETARA